MQVSWPDAATHLEPLTAEAGLNRRGFDAWDVLLKAHATLMRQLEIDLERKTGLALADFDVLAQLARAGGALRMTELADRALISRSGMTRRVARLVRDGLVRRAVADTDARGVMVLVTQAGQERLAASAPVHMRAVCDLFVAKLDDHELGVLEGALAKVILDCAFG
jgi:DNA-binding MarR family transcriptional regulator